MVASPAPGGDPAVLEDATGRRGRWMRRLGRMLSFLLVSWLVVLLVGGLGLTPVASLPFADILRPSQGPEELAAPPTPRRPLADDLRRARPLVSRPTPVSATRRISQPPPPTRAAPRRARTFTTQKRVTRRSIPAQPSTSLARGGAAPSPLTTTSAGSTTITAPGRSAVAPGQTGEAPGLSFTAAPGQSRSAPGHTGATPGRSESAPGQAKQETTTTAATPTPGPPSGRP
jgi:hypothetical protein